MIFLLPRAVTDAIDTLESAGYEAYAVGGCVRDLCRGVEPHDYDITTSATPEQIEVCFAGYRLIETGIKHGTVTVIVRGMPLEITTYRTDGEYIDNRHPESVTFSSCVSDDLSRRDFTVNAMAYSPSRGLLDLYGGREHLIDGVIACVGVPDERFGEDALRILRALRFASCFGFRIDPPTAESIHKNRALLRNISAERILAEYKRLIIGVGAGAILTEYEDVICTIMPELSGHEAYARTVDEVVSAWDDVNLRTALLLRESGNISALENLKPDGKMLSSVKSVLSILGDGFHCDDVSLRRMLRYVSYADAKRAAGSYFIRGQISAEEYDRVMAVLSRMEASQECVSPRQLAVSGHDLMACGVSEGRRVGEILEALLEAVITERVNNDRDALLDMAADLVKDSLL